MFPLARGEETKEKTQEKRNEKGKVKPRIATKRQRHHLIISLPCLGFLLFPLLPPSLLLLLLAAEVSPDTVGTDGRAGFVTRSNSAKKEEKGE